MSESDIKLINIVKGYPHLYCKGNIKTTGIDNSNELIVADTWKKISDQLNLSIEHCLSRWKYLRGRFTKESRTSLPAGGKEWPLIKHLKFLEPHINRRKRTDLTASSSKRIISVNTEEEIENRHEDDASVVQPSAACQPLVNPDRLAVQSFCDSLANDLLALSAQQQLKCRIDILVTIEKYMSQMSRSESEMSNVSLAGASSTNPPESTFFQDLSNVFSAITSRISGEKIEPFEEDWPIIFAVRKFCCKVSELCEKNADLNQMISTYQSPPSAYECDGLAGEAEESIAIDLAQQTENTGDEVIGEQLGGNMEYRFLAVQQPSDVGVNKRHTSANVVAGTRRTSINAGHGDHGAENVNFAELLIPGAQRQELTIFKGRKKTRRGRRKKANNRLASKSSCEISTSAELETPAAVPAAANSPVPVDEAGVGAANVHLTPNVAADVGNSVTDEPVRAQTSPEVQHPTTHLASERENTPDLDANAGDSCGEEPIFVENISEFDVVARKTLRNIAATNGITPVKDKYMCLLCDQILPSKKYKLAHTYDAFHKRYVKSYLQASCTFKRNALPVLGQIFIFWKKGIYCVLCNAPISGRTQFLTHVNSLEHQWRTMSVPECAVVDPPKDLYSEKAVAKFGNANYCLLCNVKLWKISPDAHVTSPDHIMEANSLKGVLNIHPFCYCSFCNQKVVLSLVDSHVKKNSHINRMRESPY